MFRSMSNKIIPLKNRINYYHSFYDNVNEINIYSFMLKRCIITRNSKLIDALDESEMLSNEVKLKTFRDVFYTLDSNDINYMILNVRGMRSDLYNYIKSIENNNSNYSSDIYKKLSILEQEIN